jgi:co-chaperonin GroES (HSP10)
MKLENTNRIRPTKDLVVVDIQVRDQEDGIYLGEDEATKLQVEMYYGKVEKMGPDARNDEHCPNLNTGDIAIFSQFAGHHIATSSGKMHKIIRGYDIMATTTNLEKINEKTLSPTADRVLIKVIHREVDESGLFLSEEDQKDPRLVDLSYGEILKKGPTSPTEFKVGDTIAYDPYVGETIRKRGSTKESELRVIRGDDILFVNEGP